MAASKKGVNNGTATNKGKDPEADEEAEKKEPGITALHVESDGNGTSRTRRGKRKAPINTNNTKPDPPTGSDEEEQDNVVDNMIKGSRRSTANAGTNKGAGRSSSSQKVGNSPEPDDGLVNSPPRKKKRRGSSPAANHASAVLKNEVKGDEASLEENKDEKSQEEKKPHEKILQQDAPSETAEITMTSPDDSKQIKSDVTSSTTKSNKSENKQKKKSRSRSRSKSPKMTDKSNSGDNANKTTAGATTKKIDEAAKQSQSNSTTSKTNNTKPSNSLSKSTLPIVSAGVLQGQGIDAHPYARGQVIEVLYIEQQSLQHQLQQNDSEDEDNVDFDLRDEDDVDMNHAENSTTNNESKKLLQETEKSQAQLQKPDIRLADIIDRAPSKTPDHEFPSHRWRYYIHYRGHNRRMDEWITDPIRILSPPSVGNAKVRAMKKLKEKEAKEKVLKEREEEEKKILAAKMKVEKELEGSSATAADGALTEELVRPVSQRASSRRASAAIANAVITGNTSTKTGGEKTGENDEATTGDVDKTGTSTVTAATTAPTVALLSPKEQEEQLRLTRRQRRKSTRSTTEDVDPTNNKEKQLSAPTTVTTLLPAANDEQIKDKIVTVAAQELDEHEGLDEASLREHEEVTKVKNVAEVQLGKFRMDTWYFSPIPKELLSEGGVLPVLYVCEFTLQFFARKEELIRFQAKELPNKKRYPPGNEIYRNGNLSMFEVDGFEERMYCQNLCYIAKLFLDHKTLYFDVDPFLFYVLCEVDNRGFHPVGYYSKEKYSDVGYNLACILTFPCHQRKGYGRFLIDFSYELSKKEEKVGSPEKPMSDLGQQAYKPYWTSTIIDFLLNKSKKESSMSIMEISKSTSIMAEDIIFTLNMLGLLKYINGVYFITAERRLLEQLARKHPVKDPKVFPDRLHWTPYLTDVKRDKFSIHSKKPSIEEENSRGNGGF